MRALNESITPSYKDIATLTNHHNYHDIPKIVINGHNDLQTDDLRQQHEEANGTL